MQNLGTDPGIFGAGEEIHIGVVVLLELVTKKELFILEDTCALGVGIRVGTLGKEGRGCVFRLLRISLNEITHNYKNGTTKIPPVALFTIAKG